jgi:LysM repeat protein
MSACVVLAWCVLPLVAVAGSRESGPAQANISTVKSISSTLASTSMPTGTSTSTATSTLISNSPSTSPSTSTSTVASTRAVLASESVTAEGARDTAGQAAATWIVRPGDTLSAIAAALGIPGGWQPLYAANRQVVGPDPNVIRPGAVLTIPGRQVPARYTVAPGDTLSAAAAALGVAGGWQALYAANRQVVGPDPNVVRPGTVLAAPRPAAPAGPSAAASGQAPQAPASAPARPRGQAPPPRQAQAQAPAASQPPRPLRQAAPVPDGRQPSNQPTASSHAPAPGQVTAPGHATAPATAGGMPRWLLDVLLAAGILAATAFAAEPAAVARRRRRQASRPAGQASRPARQARRPGRIRAPGAAPGRAGRAADKAKIILADHERLIVTYCARDHAVYVLSPPGEDPRAVLRAARLVLPEDTYEDLAGHLGVPSAWPLE